jgi:nucleoside-diphosphate-sugar epimerase
MLIRPKVRIKLDWYDGKNILVMGGTNNIGLKLVDRLLERKCNVTIATRGVHADSFGSKVKRKIITRFDKNVMRNAFAGDYYDVVFDNTAYFSDYVKYLLNCIRCDRYIQLSSIRVYTVQSDIYVESSFDPREEEVIWRHNKDLEYSIAKRDAEIAVYRAYPEISAVTIRIPFVMDTERVLYYYKQVYDGTPLNVNRLDRKISFVNPDNVSEFMIWIAENEYRGPINFSSSDYIEISDLINYAEKEFDKKAIFSEKVGPAPFQECEYNLITDKAREIGYKLPLLKDWFWKSTDKYIEACRG